MTSSLDEIYLYIPNFAGGGAERMFIRLANHYAQSGIRTKLVVNNQRGPLRGLLSDGVQLIDLRADRTRNAFTRFLRFLRHERPQVLICALTFNNISALAARQLSGGQTRLVVCERNQLSKVLLQSNRFRRAVVLGLIRRLYPRAHAIAAVATGVAKDVAKLAGLPPRAITVIQNPVPDEKEIDAARLSPVPHVWFSEQAPVLVAIGRLVKQKAYSVLLHALVQVRRTVPARLIILGEGPEQQHLERIARDLDIADAVCFEGFVLNRFDYLVRASAYALSSDYEGFPNALIEAVACRVPVVSTDCAGDGPRDILAPLLSEALVPPNDPDALAKALLKQIQDPASPDRLAQIAERFSLGRTADQFLEIAA